MVVHRSIMGARCMGVHGITNPREKKRTFMPSSALNHINASYEQTSRILALLSCRGMLPSLVARGEESGKRPWESRDSARSYGLSDPRGDSRGNSGRTESAR
ncbi:hypothetical protein CRG98_013062 [Punica granatum]|uniref:Uncharacterized protein n=1 Tax=Punica granatum TaxID=22663 RepID=A0A2I0KDC2_PUNGR|nr:hypothetical protein CRG98_013062 [Punica granatum]